MQDPRHPGHRSRTFLSLVCTLLITSLAIKKVNERERAPSTSTIKARHTSFRLRRRPLPVPGSCMYPQYLSHYLASTAPPTKLERSRKIDKTKPESQRGHPCHVRLQKGKEGLDSKPCFHYCGLGVSSASKSRNRFIKPASRRETSIIPSRSRASIVRKPNDVPLLTENQAECLSTRPPMPNE